MAIDQQQRHSPTLRNLEGTSASQSNVRIRRSPTAPGQIASTGQAENGEQNINGAGQSNGLASSQRTQQQLHPADRQKPLIVNKKVYHRLDMIGKGGSSKVYRVMNSSNEIYAIKRVSLDKTDDETINGYMNEISLLRRLEGNRRVIRLIDHESKGSGSSKGSLVLVMECGEIGMLSHCVCVTCV